MVTRIRLRKLDYFGFVILSVIILTVLGKYFYKPVLDTLATSVYDFYQSYLHRDQLRCASDQQTITVPGGNVCRSLVIGNEQIIPVTGSDSNAYLSPFSQDQALRIFVTYPLHGNGKEIIFRFMDEGDIAAADQFLNGLYPIDRFELRPLERPIDWVEEPFNDMYWRFLYFSLRPTNDLMAAYRATNRAVYSEKLLAILADFLQNDLNESIAWEDPHAVAFRTMVLVNHWWKLRELNALPVETSTEILQALQKHGVFLYKEENFERKHNHGINEAAALYLLAVNFPDMPQSDTWKEKAVERLNLMAAEIIDADGALVENSPYYHFYVLEKLWEINQYTQNHTPQLSNMLDSVITKMVHYGTHVIYPNLEIPLIGASLQRTLHNTGVQAEIGRAYPEYQFVLSQGREGTIPAQSNINFHATGQTILRSDWGNAENFSNQTQVIFNIGEYRSGHSQYDALSFTLYGDETALMPDAGLFTYEAGKYEDYFKGTHAHNTVVVDDKDQKAGEVYQGQFKQGNGFSYQSASHNLYDGVTHERAIALLGKNLVLIVDQLVSEEEHTYRQMFHLAPEAQISVEGLTVTGTTDNQEHSIIIHQLEPDGAQMGFAIGQKEPLDGICSNEYGKIIPCFSVSYTRNGKNERFITILEIGKADPDLEFHLDRSGETIVINDGKHGYEINLSQFPAVADEIAVNKGQIPPAREVVVENFQSAFEWIVVSQTGIAPKILDEPKDYPSGQNSVRLPSPRDGSWVAMSKGVNWDLTNQNLLIQMKVENAQAVKSLELILTSHDNSTALTRINNSYRQDYSGEWIEFGLGKGFHRQNAGQWDISGAGFQWSEITQVTFRVSSLPGQSAGLLLSKIALTPVAQEGSVTFVFDDGSSTIRPAIDLMREYKMRGTIGVISSYVLHKGSNTLSLSEFKYLQDQDGWVLLNHSWYHKNALETYYPDKLDLLEQDILQGQKYLSENGINSNPNWYIYPNGATNEAIKEIVAKYYLFARTVNAQPEIIIPGDPLLIKTFPIQDTTSFAEVYAALLDAKEYHLPLLLTLHRFQTATDPRGYDLEQFRRILEAINTLGLEVKTVSDLDRDFGVTPTTIEIVEGHPELIELEISATQNQHNFWEQVIGWMRTTEITQVR